MANSRKSGKKSATVAQFPQPENAVGVEETPESFQVAPATQPEPTKPPPRNPLKKKTPAIPPGGDFFARVNAIPREEWDSQRIYLYLYVLEPLCNLKQSGGKSYLNRYSEPVRDEHQIALEYGSGRYRLMLAYNKVSPDESTEVARHEFEIYNKQYPPTVPKAAWINDARNAKWEALLPKEAPPAAATSTLIEGARFYKEIRDEVKDEMEPAEVTPNSPREMFETMKAAKDLFAPATTPTATVAKDPLEIATALFTIMNQTKAENPVIDMYRDELKAAREEMKEMRAAAVHTQTAEKPKTFLEQMTEFKTLKELFTAVSSETVTRTGGTGALDVVRDLGSKFFESDLATGVGQWLGSLAQRNVNGNPAPSAMNGAPPPQVQQSQPDQFQAFITNVLNPALLRHYLQEFSGADFAGWLYDAFPDRLQQLQNFTHPMMPGLKGAPAIIQAYKRTDSMWPALSSRGEQAFVDFVHQFCEWKPDTNVVDAEVIEPEASEQEEGPERI